MRGWNRFPNGMVAAPSLEVFNVRLNWAWSNLIYWKVPLLMAEEDGNR